MNLHPKVAASAVGAGVGSAVATVAVWAVSLAGIVVPPGVEQAMDVIFSAAIAGLSGYLTPSKVGS